MRASAVHKMLPKYQEQGFAATAVMPDMPWKPDSDKDLKSTNDFTVCTLDWHVRIFLCPRPPRRHPVGAGPKGRGNRPPISGTLKSYAKYELEQKV